MVNDKVEFEQEQTYQERRLSLIQRFLCICAGVDKDVLRQCPTEWNKYTGIGATILFTGILAALSGGYALYTVFRNGNDLNTTDTSALLPAVLFGVLWGLIIFNLDRFIVSTFRKTEETAWWKKYGKELLQASPRIVLAIIIAIVISKPIEIKIFENRLAEQILHNLNEARKANKSTFEQIHGISERESDVADKANKDSILRQELVDDPPIVKNLLDSIAKAESDLVTVKNNNEPQIANHNNSIRNIRNNQSNYRPVYDAEGNEMRDNNGNIKQNLTKEAQNNIANYNDEISKLRKEISAKQKEVDKINNQIAEERKRYKEQKQTEINENKQAQRVAEAKLDSAKVKVNEETAKADETSKIAFTNNFITQIEALGDLTKGNTTMWWVSLMITLLFLTIELAPILTKLITRRSSYDEILDRTEYEKMIEQKEIISRKNSEINELLKQAEEAAKLSAEIKMQSEQYKLEAELRVNKTILDDIAQKQEELALEAIDKWYQEEKQKLDVSPAGTYVTTIKS